ncbi:type II toxin-antitoxin system RelB/DinJ family antitoxin [Clostridiales bacterium COT073_COT-073]|nr:type II toxin-antitoxin system RelB/DinJ family antitoxin [Clostridiales bacterium COT073_COT-073]
MKYTNLSARVDVEDKKNFEDFCENTGMNVSVAINLFIKAVLRENKLPFTISYDPFYSEKNRSILKESIAQAEEGKVVVKTMDELLEMENE